MRYLCRKVNTHESHFCLGDPMVISEEKMREEILEILEDVMQSKKINDYNEQYVEMMDSTLRKRFDIGAMKSGIVEKIKRISDDVDLEVSVKSGTIFGNHEKDDWIVFTYNPVPPPEPEWFDEMIGREYESEIEVMTYFIAPLLEKLGYNFDDIVMGYPIEAMKGAKKEKPKQADVVLFKDRGRDLNDVLLLVEAKSMDKDIAVKDKKQAESYVIQLKPPVYIVTNGKMIYVIAFNQMKTQDSEIMSFDKSMLKDVWKDFYRRVSKIATVKAKMRLAQ